MSSIEWTEKTWNPTTGCTKISKACDFCYAEVMTNRLQAMGQQKYKEGFDVLVEHNNSLEEPFKWREPKTVFVNSMSDLFHKDVTLEFLKKTFKVMNDTPQHTYQILTKRGSLLVKHSKELKWTDNIWAGISVGEQSSVRQIDYLKQCDAKNKFLSVEPLIEHIENYDLNGIDWVIVGGESGPKARPIKAEWIESVRQECIKNSTPFFFKQWGDKKFNTNPNDPTLHKLHRYHSKGGSELNGVTYWENPTTGFNSANHKVRLFQKEYAIMDEIQADLQNGNEKVKLITIWQLKVYLPIAEENSYELLKESIKLNGVIDPVLYFETTDGDNIVIEGHTRLKAAIQLKLQHIPCKKINETFESLDEIKLWMVKHQVQRRNLTHAQKVRIAFNSKETIEKQAKKNLSKGGKQEIIENKIDTYSAIAKIAGVGRGTIARYNSVINSNNESLIKNLYKGNITISNAYNQIKDKPIPKPKTEKVSKLIFIDFNSIESATKALFNGDIDLLTTSNNKNTEKAINTNKTLKIGVLKVQ